MTPCIHAATQAKIAFTIHQYEHESTGQPYGLEAAERLDIAPERVFKTLVVLLDTGEFVLALVPASAKLNMKLIAKALGTKKANMAPVEEVIRVTGYVLGGVSPLGQKKNLQTVIDSSARNHSTILVSAGKRGLELELSPDDLAKLTAASFTTITEPSR